MIDASVLLQLPSPVLTVYLDTNPGERENQGRHPAYRTWLKDEAKLIANDVPISERRGFREQIKRVEGSLQDLTSHQRSLLLFAGPRTWKEFPLGLPLQSELHWGAPAVSQLIEVMNEHKPCYIVALDRAGARFFRYHLNSMTELPAMEFRVNTKQRRKKTRAGSSRRRAPIPSGPQRDAFRTKLEDAYRRFCRGVAARTNALRAAPKKSPIFLVGPKRLTEIVEARLVGKFHRGVILIDEDLARASVSRLHVQLAPRIAACLNDTMERRVQDLLKKRRGTVFGVDETLAKLQRGEISSILMVRGLNEALRECVACGCASRTADRVCSRCGGKTVASTLHDFLPRAAIFHHAEIELVSGATEKQFAELGGIGGWVRQRRQPRATSRARPRL